MSVLEFLQATLRVTQLIVKRILCSYKKFASELLGWLTVAILAILASSSCRTGPRIAGMWNSLPPSIVNFSSLLLSKKTINHVHVNLFTRY